MPDDLYDPVVGEDGQGWYPLAPPPPDDVGPPPPGADGDYPDPEVNLGC